MIINITILANAISASLGSLVGGNRSDNFSVVSGNMLLA